MDRYTALSAIARETRDFCRFAERQTKHHTHLHTQKLNAEVLHNFTGMLMFCCTTNVLEPQTYGDILTTAQTVIDGLRRLRKLNDKVPGSGEQQESILNEIGRNLMKLQLAAEDLNPRRQTA